MKIPPFVREQMPPVRPESVADFDSEGLDRPCCRLHHRMRGSKCDRQARSPELFQDHEATIPHSAKPETHYHPLRGYFFIAGATFLWGVCAALGRAVFTGRLLSGAAVRPIDPVILSQTRTTFSLMVLVPALLGIRGWERIKLPRADLVRCLILGMFGVAASNYFYYVAIQKTNVATA